MKIVDKYIPLNSKEKVDDMMNELHGSPYLMTPALYTEIMQHITKFKIQQHFQTYKDKFTASPKDLPTANVVLNKNEQHTTVAKLTAQSPISPKEMVQPVIAPKECVEAESKKEIVLPKETLGEQKYIYGTYVEMAFHNFFLTLNHIYGKISGHDVMKEALEKIEVEKQGLKLKLKEAEDRLQKAESRFKIIQSQYETGFEPQDLIAAKNSVRNAKEKLQRKEDSKKAIDFAQDSLWDTMFHVMENGKPEEVAKANELVRKHFPFLTPMLDVDKEKNAIRILRDLSIAIRPIRNEFSHYKFSVSDKQASKFIEREDGIIRGLKNCFDGSKREVKSRFALNDAEMKCSDRFEQYTDSEHKDRNGRPQKRMREIANYAYKIDTVDNEKQHHFTEFGLLSLISLFLEKKYIKIFADKLHIIRKQDEKVITEMLSIYRIRMHVRKLTCDKNIDAIALDILNELQKCPKELFEMLTPEDQKKFRVEIEVSEDSQMDEVLMVRHSDRFAYLLMKYIDDAGLFEEIRFQVSLGNYYYKFYNKKCIDSQEADRVRSLSNSVTGFGRITEIEEARRNVYNEMIREYEDVHKNTDEEKPYITDHRANYVFNGNRIGMWIPKNGERIFMPELMDDGVRNMAPTCWMSIYELPALAFDMLLNGASYVEKTIKRTVSRYKKLFTDIQEGTLVPQTSKEILDNILNKNYDGIKLADIPKNMQCYLLGKSIDIKAEYQKWAKDILERMLESTYLRIDHFKEDSKTAGNHKMNKIGKKQYVEIKPGKLADYLSKDIMLFQPLGEDGRNKLTGLNYQILQASIATYKDGDFERLKRIFTSAHLIGNADEKLDNPIVIKVCERYTPKNTGELYADYLKERAYYLKQCLKNPDDYSKLKFLYGNRSKWNERSTEFYKSLAGRYLKDEYGGTEFEKSLELPRGMFDDSIREKIATLSPSLKVLAGDRTKNVSYLIYAYFKEIVKDDAQDFYGYKRNYKLFDSLWKLSPRAPKVYKNPQEMYLLINKIGGKRAVDAEIEKAVGKIKYVDKRERMTLEQKRTDEMARLLNSLKVLKNTETDLKRYKIQDMLMFLVAKSILLDEKNGESKKMQGRALENMKLKSITNGKVLSQPISFSVTVNTLEGAKKTVSQENLKLKNYAQFFRFLYDRRIPSLLDLVSSGEISREELEKEFEIYDKVHPGIFKEVFEYEKEYYSQHPDDEEKSFRDIIRENNILHDADINIMASIRNSFAHAVYTTDVEKAKIIDLPKKAEIIAEIFRNYLEKTE